LIGQMLELAGAQSKNRQEVPNETLIV
jgi:hypothetical protein